MHTNAKIISAIRGGDCKSALVEVDRLLDANPEDSDLLGLKGLALAMSGRIPEAVTVVRQAVANAGSQPQYLKHAGNLARLLASSEQQKELRALTGLNLPRLESLPKSEFDAAAVENLCASLLLAGCHDFVAAYIEPILDWQTTNWDLERLWLTAAHKAGQYDKIVARCDQVNYRWKSQPEALALACSSAAALNRQADVKRLYWAYLAHTPLYTTPRQETQILSIALISPNPPVETTCLPLRQQHLMSNFPSQLVKRRPDRYRFISVFVGSEPRSIAAEIGPGERVITLNNLVNGERLRGGDLEAVQRHEQALGFAVVNPAAQALHCTRQETAELLKGIPGLIVPKVMRFRLDAALTDALRSTIGELFAFPILLRTVGQQQGVNIHLVSRSDELDVVLAQFMELGEKEFYVIEYVGVEHANGFFRRFRAAYVEGAPTIMRLDYDRQWMVKGRKNERILAHYRKDPTLFREANSFVEQPQQIGETAWRALREVGRRIPLDVFGLDFEVDDQGRVVFFEANATMNLLSNASGEFDYPISAEQEFLARLDRFFMKRAGLSLQ
jgi:hypothetical protein